MEIIELNSQEIQIGDFVFDRSNYNGEYICYDNLIKSIDKYGELSRVLWVIKHGERLKWTDEIYHLDGNYQDFSYDNLGHRKRVWIDWEVRKDFEENSVPLSINASDAAFQASVEAYNIKYKEV